MGPYRRSLRVIQIESPCTLPWDGMEGLGPMRFCTACDQNVYDLSELTAPEADELIELFEGSLCVRLTQRADGTLVSADCTGMSAMKKRRRVIRMMATGAASLALVAATFGAAWLVEPEGRQVHPLNRRAPPHLEQRSPTTPWGLEPSQVDVGPREPRHSAQMGRYSAFPVGSDPASAPDPWESLGRSRTDRLW